MTTVETFVGTLRTGLSVEVWDLVTRLRPLVGVLRAARR